MCVRDAACGQCLQDTSQYVLSELAALETEQKHIDSRAAVVERRLRSLMETGERHVHRTHRPQVSDRTSSVRARRNRFITFLSGFTSFTSLGINSLSDGVLKLPVCYRKNYKYFKYKDIFHLPV